MNKGKNIAQRVALVGICAATLEVGKLALSFIPNVEIVTILTALYGYTFGVWGILSAVVFVCIEPLLWGFGTWMISYFIHWPLVALIFMIFGKCRIRSRIILTGAALLLTFFFGILTSLVDIGLFSGNFDRFFYRFGIYYMRGIVFYIIQIACNAVLFPLVFLKMHKFLKKLNN